MNNIDFNKERKLMLKADLFVLSGYKDKALEIIKEVFKNDFNHLNAFYLTESNPEYSLYSKELNELVHKYMLDLCLNNLDKKINKHA